MSSRTQGDNRGLRCWHRSYDRLKVVYTRKRLSGQIRRRECKRCKKRMTTWERMIGCPPLPCLGGETT
jgi:transcriptional regulator NrdR family protein